MNNFNNIKKPFKDKDNNNIMIEEIKINKSIFFKNKSDKGGAMARAITEHIPNSVLIHSQSKSNGNMLGYSKPQIQLKNL
jgi:hypothetical protein